MKFLVQTVVSLLLLAVALFCAYGFLATFEPPGFIGFRIGYGVIGSGSVLGVVALWVRSLLSGPA